MYKIYCGFCDWNIGLFRKIFLKTKIGKSKNAEWNVIEQFLRFICVGVTNVLITLGIYYVFLYLNPTLYLFGNTVGYLAGVFNSYYLNSMWVFKKEKFNFREFFKTCGCYLITFFLQTFFLFMMIEILYWSDLIAPIINVLLTTPINFVLNKIWAFKE